MWRATLTIFWIGFCFFGVGVLVAFVLRWWPGDRLQPVRVVNYLMPWFLTGLLPALLLALLTQRNMLALTLAAPTLFICITYAPLWGPSRTVALPDGMPLKVMSYNVWRENHDMTEVARVIRSQQPDVLLLQEIDAGQLERLSATLENSDGNELFMVFEPHLQQAVISRFPLKQVGASWRKGRAQKVLASTPRGPITVINAHPLRGNWKKRHKQMSRLLEDDIIPADGPVILGGDFNTTDQSQTYRMINRVLNNAHWEAGRGFGFSFPSSSSGFKLKGILPIPPLVRIDHIFYSSHFVVQDAGTLPDSGGSDHLPVVAELIL